MGSKIPRISDSVSLGGDDLKTRKNLRSAVITENDSMKIMLKITKRDIVEPVKSGKREGSAEAKVMLKNHKNSSVHGRSGEDSPDRDEKTQKTAESEDEPKMKLRSKRETEDDGEQKNREETEEGSELDKRKKYHKGEEVSTGGSDILEKPIAKKRGRMSKLQIEENERLEEKRRLKRLEMEGSEGDRDSDGTGQLKESFCWTCHKDGSVVKCDTCPRVFHLKCVSLSKDPSKDWICPECSLVLHAEKMSTRSEAMKNLSLDQLCTLLNFAIGRMKNVPESQVFWKPVDPKEVPFYDKYITNPMDLNLLEKNMKAKMYGSPQAFLADAKWLLHNSIIFNSTQSPLTSTARFLVKICKQEMAEIENCPDCYLNAHTKKEWFIEVCRKPHILIWARLKGFPFWPAKAMSTNLKTQSVDARFFGAHDKAWVPVKECYLYSKNSPQVISKKRTDMGDAFQEAEGYIRKIKQKYGSFCYAPDKTPFIPEMYDKQLQSMIPTYQEDKTPKKKRKKPVAEENGVMEKTVQTGKKLAEHGTQHRFKLKGSSSMSSNSSNSADSTKESNDICYMSEYVSDEKILSEDKISPEDEVAQSLEMYDTASKVDGGALDENSTDMEEDGSIPIPEHGYSRNFGSENDAESTPSHENDGDSVETMREVLSNDDKQEKDNYESNKCDNKEEDEVENPVDEVETGKDSSDVTEDEPPDPPRKEAEDRESSPEKEPENEQCVVSSTSTEIIADTPVEREERQTDSMTDVEEYSPANSKRKSVEETTTEPPKKVQARNGQELKTSDESLKKNDERSAKSFTNLTGDQKQKILTEAKLLANIDEMPTSRKQKVLNELGLDPDLVDIPELARENREILDTLTKKGHSETTEMEDIEIKREDLEQYLLEESNQESPPPIEPEKDESPPPPRLGSIKVRDIQLLSNMRVPNKTSSNPDIQISNIESVTDLKSWRKLANKKLQEESNPKKLKLDPVIELIKLDNHDKSIEKLNTKLRLSDEVSLLMVDGEKKTKLDGTDAKLPLKRLDRPHRARKSMPNRTRQREIQSSDVSSAKASTKNVSVISVDTENSNAQKSLLKSLCSDERKGDDEGGGGCGKSNKKTVLITTNDKGIKNVDVTTSEDVSKKALSEVTIESVGSDGLKDGGAVSLCPQKNVTVVANSHLILTNNGPTFLTNQNNQPNLALAQNNLGQLSLVHLTNLTSGIQTNFVNLTNETIGVNNSLGAVYASPNFVPDGPGLACSSTGNGPVLLTPSPATSVSCSPVGSVASSSSSKPSKGSSDVNTKYPGKSQSRPTSGISVKSPASLGLVVNQSSKVPPVSSKVGEDSFAEVGSVTAELNRHSIKMAEYMRATIEDILRELSNQGSLEAKYKSLTIEMEKLQWRHQQEIMELKHHSERSLMELRTTLESDKQKCLAELKSQLEARHQKIISETKNKQWCANCGKEALFYCCWNTSYCDYPCQQQHWPGHMSRCAQLGNNAQNSSQMQSKNTGLKYQNTGYVPMMSRAGGSHTSGPFASSRSVSSAQAQSQGRRSSDPQTPQLPINITIRPQHYFM